MNSSNNKHLKATPIVPFGKQDDSTKQMGVGAGNNEDYFVCYANQNTNSTYDKNTDTNHVLANSDEPPYNDGMETRVKEVENRLNTVDSALAGIKSDITEMKSDIKDVSKSISTLIYWVVGTAITSLLAMIAVVIAFGSFQAIWFQNSLDRNWDQGQKALEKIEDSQLRLERMDTEQRIRNSLNAPSNNQVITEKPQQSQ